MNPEVDVLIDPLTIRFSLWEGSPVYQMAGDPDIQLDGMERMMDIDPEENVIFDTNLGFLPISSTTLIQGEKNILVDPGNFHVGFYGLVGRALDSKGLMPEDIDIVLATHYHFDHMASTHMFPESTLVIGEGELDAAREVYWPELIDALTTARVDDVETVSEDDGMMELCEGVSAFSTPGHSPASISVWVETEDQEIAIIGDLAMTKTDYTERNLSHWYTDEQVEQIHEGLDMVQELDPDLVVPGHDYQFEPN
jgi:glyoxylase-like metal-dependent hydrolase (beta-lactamase superfamily II)